MKKILLLLILFTLIITACDDSITDDTVVSPTLSLKFIGNYNGADFILDKYYPTQGIETKFTKFNCYITDIELLTANGSEKIADAGFIDFINTHVSGNTNRGELVEINDIPEGSYTGIRFGIGVAPNINSTSPADYEFGNPLNKASHYWTWKESYIFSMLEGRVDTIGNRNDNDGLALQIHTGLDQVYQTFETAVDFTIEAGDQPIFNFDVDVSKFFDNLNVKTDFRHHGSNDDLYIGVEMLKNIKNSISLRN